MEIRNMSRRQLPDQRTDISWMPQMGLPRNENMKTYNIIISVLNIEITFVHRLRF